MSNRHLPAGQTGAIHGVDMAGGPGGNGGGGGGGGGPRRRPPPQYVPQYHQQHMNPMYPTYMPYAPQQYYAMPPQYQNGAMPSAAYMPYQNYTRSPPPMPQYVPMVGVSVPPTYPRPAQQSPALATPYQPPPAPMPPHTPSSTHSSQLPPPPTPPTPQTGESVTAPVTAPAPAPVPAPAPAPDAAPAPVPSAPEPEPVTSFLPYRPPLPWFSLPDSPFPPRNTRLRRRKKALNASSQAVSLPVEQIGGISEQKEKQTQDTPQSAAAAEPVTEEAPASTAMSESPQSSRPGTAASTSSTKPAQGSVRGGGPALPAIPALPKATAKSTKPEATPEGSKQVAKEGEDSTGAEASTNTEAGSEETKPAPAVKAPPTSWANLFARPVAAQQAGSTGTNGTVVGEVAVNGGSADPLNAAHLPGSAISKANALADVIRAYQVSSGEKISFLEPRGLVNTGNMCYLNSVLQILTFCGPFHEFLDQVSKRAAHSFKSETPLIDAMVMFMQEFKSLKAASSTEQLQRSLKGEDLEKFGDPFTPEFVYEAIRQDSRFENMKRGHQQDAEEFLGFLLQSLKDECTRIMSSSSSGVADQEPVPSSPGTATDPSGDWLEVGRKQRAAVTRSSGSNSSMPKTPIDKIFGGEVRSELRVPGNQDSITIQPSQPLQLDIDSDDVRNVVDALRGITRPESIKGDFKSPRGKDVPATKQVFIESLPPVLILHLKRFQFDEGTGTVRKIPKKIGYPLELEIPREALSRQRRQTMGDGAMPKYNLTGVIYHHGKNASVGHYTVDVRRQDGDSWIRIDDTHIRSVRSEDVAESAPEGEVREARKDGTNAIGQTPAANRFGAINDEDAGDEDGWNQVKNSATGNKRWNSVVNGTSQASTKGKQVKDNIKDNRVAYLLFYQRV